MHHFRICSVLTLLLALATIPLCLDAQKREFPQPKLPADPKIAAALKEISPQQIQGTIEKLVSFGTRLTLSAQDPGSIAGGHGIGAAREWIKSEFDRYSRDCGGCLEVRTDTFTQPPADRIPQPTEITNVYAVLRGTDPGQAKRVVLVTGHYDSRNSDTLDETGAAPGANDDGSGTAVSLECARVLSKMKFPATIIFLTVAGEEQGLNGSHHFAWMADQKRDEWQIEAVLNNDIVGGDKNPQPHGPIPPMLLRFLHSGPRAIWAEAIRPLSTNTASRPSDLPNSAKITTTSIRTCAPKMASNMAMCPSSSTSITWPVWPA